MIKNTKPVSWLVEAVFGRLPPTKEFQVVGDRRWRGRKTVAELIAIFNKLPQDAAVSEVTVTPAPIPTFGPEYLLTRKGTLRKKPPAVPSLFAPAVMRIKLAI